MRRVGGLLAGELARAGVGMLTLLDPDTIRPENTYRHVLGRPYWGQNKALALGHALTMQLPCTKVRAIPTTIEQALDDSAVRPGDFDLIISAIGNPTSELDLNRRVRAMDGGPPIIFTWLDPLGIGGHAVLTGSGDTPGCFACLYTPTQPDDVALDNRASFGAAGQRYSQSMARCSSLYTRYGSLDAAQTAHLATRLALDVLVGRETRNVLRSWSGGVFAQPALRVQPGAAAAARGGVSKPALPDLRFTMVNDQRHRVLIFARPDGTRFEISADAWRAMRGFAQHDTDAAEAGGVLLGRHLRDGSAIIVDAVTVPMDGDRRGRARFDRARHHHQQAIDEAWRASDGTCTYLGEWHTHPESIPTPSRVDLSDWRRRLRSDRYTEPLFFVVVGTTAVKAWEGRRPGAIVTLRLLDPPNDMPMPI